MAKEIEKGKITLAQQKELLSLHSKKKKAIAEFDEASSIRLEKKNAVEGIEQQIAAVMEEAVTGQKRLPFGEVEDDGNEND